MNALSSLISRILFIGAFLLAGLAVLEKIVNWGGYTFLPGSYGPSRLLELAAVALMFLFALQLREIRQAVEARSKL
jgi:hypothetical protein